ncbi:unnamed protein product [Cuscuta europaea]|uniref:Uncharacterized protein n=1 Tax=Cuscuta europaea TaxID=41803 RepID=A0A9P0YKZ2_CUSEU|nr:unnamed protein product [Cuscuta europaea]
MHLVQYDVTYIIFGNYRFNVLLQDVSDAALLSAAPRKTALGDLVVSKPTPTKNENAFSDIVSFSDTAVVTKAAVSEVRLFLMRYQQLGLILVLNLEMDRCSVMPRVLNLLPVVLFWLARLIPLFLRLKL